MKSFAVVSDWDANMSQLAEHVFPNREQYCLKHNYACYKSHYGTQWGKVSALLEHWHKADWLFWMDVDTFITNPSVSLESISDDAYDLIITSDIFGMNTGLFLVRTNDRMKSLLEQCVSKKGFYQSHQCSEQTALACLSWQFKDHVKIVPQKLLNSYPAGYNQGEAATWTKGDFIAHMPGTPNDYRIGQIKKLMNGEEIV